MLSEYTPCSQIIYEYPICCAILRLRSLSHRGANTLDMQPSIVSGMVILCSPETGADCCRSPQLLSLHQVRCCYRKASAISLQRAHMSQRKLSCADGLLRNAPRVTKFGPMKRHKKVVVTSRQSIVMCRTDKQPCRARPFRNRVLCPEYPNKNLIVQSRDRRADPLAFDRRVRRGRLLNKRPKCESESVDAGQKAR